MKISYDCNNSKTLECNDYGWSNELADSYKECFEKMHTSPINVSSVGGGDHILFTLLSFDTVKIINNIDVSPIGLLSSLVKLVVISHGSLSDWFELLTGSLLEERLIKFIEKSGMSDAYKKLGELFTFKTKAMNPLISLSTTSINYDLWQRDISLNMLKERLNNIEGFNFILHDIFDIDLINEGITKEQSDLFLISNAYNYTLRKPKEMPSFVLKSLKIGGYIIASGTYEWRIDKHLRVEYNPGRSLGNWQFNLIRRVA